MVRHSIPAGEVVLANLPPYGTQPWLSTGLVYLEGLLRTEGVAARVVRTLPVMKDVPAVVAEASFFTYLRDPTMEERLDAMERACASEPLFFDGLVNALLAGPERVVAFSVFRNNVDVSLWVARLLKKRRPECIVIFGGPEAIEEPEALRLPWVDVVVGRNADIIWLPLMRALLDGRHDRLPHHRALWVGPELEARRRTLPTELPPPPAPRIDYAALMPLLLGDDKPTIPVWLNFGCPYHCSFCSNQNLYGRFVRGEIDPVMAQLDEIVEAWKALQYPQTLNIQFSDATTNVLPQQLDSLLRRVISAQARWGIRPLLRGQTLFDRRITEDSVKLWVEANFAGVFFGLDAVNDEQRRDLGKPGTRAEVEQAIRTYQRAGGEHLFFGVPVGMPGETRARFEETAEFVGWAAGLSGAVEGVTILPYMFFLQGQDPTWNLRNTGERRGLLWRMDDPAGDPAERARRCMELFDRVGDLVEATTPFPPECAWPMMLPEAERSGVRVWLDRHGEIHDQLDGVDALDPADLDAPKAEPPTLLDPQEFERLTGTIKAGLSNTPWTLEGCESNANLVDTPSVIFLIADARTSRRVAVTLQATTEGRRVFARTRRFMVSYLQQWQGDEFVFDAALMARCLDVIGHWEGAARPTALAASAQ